jgi:hypothetical protein
VSEACRIDCQHPVSSTRRYENTRSGASQALIALSVKPIARPKSFKSICCTCKTNKLFARNFVEGPCLAKEQACGQRIPSKHRTPRDPGRLPYK